MKARGYQQKYPPKAKEESAQDCRNSSQGYDSGCLTGDPKPLQFFCSISLRPVESISLSAAFSINLEPSISFVGCWKDEDCNQLARAGQGLTSWSSNVHHMSM